MLVWMSKEEKKEYETFKIIKYEDKLCCACGCENAEVISYRKMCSHCANDDLIECAECGKEIYSRESYSCLCEECFERED